MALYQVHHARGSLWARQQAAKRAGCLGYVEVHHNAVASPTTNFVMAIVDINASKQSHEWADHWCSLQAAAFNLPNRGVTRYPGRGSYNVRFIQPAILTEGGCFSNEEFAAVVRTGGGLEQSANVLVQSIRDCFPNGGLIGLSAGHAYRDKYDPGAPAGDKGEDPDGDGVMADPDFDDETEINIAVVDFAAELLLCRPVRTEPSPPPSERQP